MRRRLSDRERVLLWQAAKGLCQRCGAALGDDWEADHVIPWRVTGRTNPHEMQALCRICNRKKGGRLEMSGEQFIDMSKARPGQKGAHMCLLDRIRQEQQESSIILPTGYGKSDVIRNAAFDLWARGVVCCTLVLNCTDYLKRQLLDDDKWWDWVRRYRIQPPAGKPFKPTFIDRVGINYTANGEFLLSTTVQLVEQNLEHFGRYVESMIWQHKLPFLVCADETQTFSHSNEWGKVLTRLQDEGAHICVMTATPWREDREPLFGFRLTEKGEHYAKPVTRHWTRPSIDVGKRWLITAEGTEYHYELQADYQYSWRAAWDENALCHISDHWVDVDLNEIDPEQSTTEKRMLSMLPALEARQQLPKLIRHPAVIRKVCEMLLDWLYLVRVSNPINYNDCAFLVFTANDQGDGTNEHAKQIVAILHQVHRETRLKFGRELLPERLDCRIATSADDQSTATAGGRQVLEDFALRGIGDGLAVKQYAANGLDAERVKIVVDLSSTRAAGASLQRWNRATRPYKGLLKAHLISLMDVLNVSNFNRYVIEQGGEAVTSELEVVNEKLIDDNPQTRPVFLVEGVRAAGVDDTKGNFAALEAVARVVAILRRAPVLLSTMTVPEIALAFEGVVVPEVEEINRPQFNSATQAEDQYQRINAAAPSLANLRFIRRFNRSYEGGRREDSQAYGGIIAAVFHEAYERAGVPTRQGSKGLEFPSLREIRDLAQLERIYDVLQEMAAAEVAQ